MTHPLEAALMCQLSAGSNVRGGRARDHVVLEAEELGVYNVARKEGDVELEE